MHMDTDLSSHIVTIHRIVCNIVEGLRRFADLIGVNSKSMDNPRATGVLPTQDATDQVSQSSPLPTTASTTYQIAGT